MPAFALTNKFISQSPGGINVVEVKLVIWFAKLEIVKVELPDIVDEMVCWAAAEGELANNLYVLIVGEGV